MQEHINRKEDQNAHVRAFRMDGPENRENDGRILSGEALLMGMGWGIVAFLLGICRLPFSVYPLGVAFLCASDTYLGFSLAGLVVSSFFTSIPVWVNLSVLALTLFVRVLTRLFVDIPVRSHEVVGLHGILEHIHGRLFCESVYLRMTCSCVSVFALSLYAIIAGGLRYYDLFGAFFSMAVAPIATFFYCSLFGDLPMRSAWLPRVRRMAKSLLAFSLCLSFGGVNFEGVSLEVMAAFAATLILCRREGLLLGLCTSILCGFSCEVSYVVVFPVVAVVAFSLFEFSPYLSAFVSCIVGCITGVLTIGREELLSLFLPLLLGASVYCAFEKLFFQKGFLGILHSGAKGDACDFSRAEARNAALDTEILGICHSLNLLSNRLISLNDPDRDRLCIEKTQVFAEGYRTAAELFSSAVEHVRLCFREDEKKTVAVRDKLREIGFDAEQVRVCGDEHIKIFISGLAPIPEYKRLVYLQKQLGRTLDCQRMNRQTLRRKITDDG